MNVISLGVVDLTIAAFLLILLALASFLLKLGLERRMLLAGSRMVIQLLLIGQVLRLLFTNVNPWWIVCMSMVMLFVAAREVRDRQKRRLHGFTGYGIGMISMFVSSFSVTVFALIVMIQVHPWYTPQYAIPLLGMVLGNTMTGVALASDNLTSRLYEQRGMVEQRLLLGQTWQTASSDIRKDCIIAAGTGFGVICSIWMTSRHLFDKRHRLCLDQLISGRS
jgi:putative ABC transport system permease protein